MKGESAVGEGAESVSGAQVLSRTIPGAVLAQYTEKIRSMEGELSEYFRQEKMKANLDSLQMEAEKAENLLLHEDEISARPARTWYQTEKQKEEQRETSRGQVKDEQAEAQLGKEDAKVVRSAAERARALALTDDYPLDRKEVDKSHKMSRKKRRRLEALAASHADDSGDEAKPKPGQSGEYFIVILLLYCKNFYLTELQFLQPQLWSQLPSVPRWLCARRRRFSAIAC